VPEKSLQFCTLARGGVAIGLIEPRLGAARAFGRECRLHFAERAMPEKTDSVSAWDGEQSDYAQYLLHSRPEIVQVLRGVMKATELVTAYFDHGAQFFLTSVVGVDPAADALYLDHGTNRETNLRALQAVRLVFVTSQDKVKVQFSTGPLQEVEFHGRPAFRTRLPQALLKLQRREYYRLVTPIRSPLVCVVPTPEGPLDAMVTDISVGGVGLTGLPAATSLAVDQRHPGCRIVLPDEGVILTAIEVRSVQDVTLRSGAVVKRAGCRFVDIPASQQAMIQRYIIRIDRERLALVKGS
jgi:c-di-GMP-binding flagellar brake protein YcgR